MSFKNSEQRHGEDAVGKAQEHSQTIFAAEPSTSRSDDHIYPHGWVRRL